MQYVALHPHFISFIIVIFATFLLSGVWADTQHRPFLHLVSSLRILYAPASIHFLASPSYSHSTESTVISIPRVRSEQRRMGYSK